MVPKEVNKLVESAVTALGYELLGCELVQQRGKMILRVYVDSPHGITLDDCVEASRQISAVLDVEDPVSIGGRYDLEVSSPGLDRPLFSLAQYQRFIGHKVKFRLRLAQDDRRNFVGVLTAIHDNKITFDVSEKEVESKLVTFDFNEIERANLVPEL